jgi:hypothetical protein
LIEQAPGWRVEMREGTGRDAYELLAKTPGAAQPNSPCAAAIAPAKH